MLRFMRSWSTISYTNLLSWKYVRRAIRGAEHLRCRPMRTMDHVAIMESMLGNLWHWQLPTNKVIITLLDSFLAVRICFTLRTCQYGTSCQQIYGNSAQQSQECYSGKKFFPVPRATMRVHFYFQSLVLRLHPRHRMDRGHHTGHAQLLAVLAISQEPGRVRINMGKPAAMVHPKKQFHVKSCHVADMHRIRIIYVIAMGDQFFRCVPQYYIASNKILRTSVSCLNIYLYYCKIQIQSMLIHI